jgi:isochorismate hydrolase
MIFQFCVQYIVILLRIRSTNKIDIFECFGHNCSRVASLSTRQMTEISKQHRLVFGHYSNVLTAKLFQGKMTKRSTREAIIAFGLYAHICLEMNNFPKLIVGIVNIFTMH